MYSILYRQTEKGYVYIFKKYPTLGSGMIFENFGKNKKREIKNSCIFIMNKNILLLSRVNLTTQEYINPWSLNLFKLR